MNVICLSGQDYDVYRKSPIGGFSYDGVKDIIQDKDGFMWFILNNNMIRYDGEDYKFYFDKIKQKNISALLTFKHLYLNNQNELYVSTNQGIFKYNLLTDNFELVYNQTTGFLFIDSNNNFWVEDKQNVFVYDPSTKTTSNLICQSKTLESAIKVIEKDKQIWIADKSNNIYTYDIKKNDYQLEPFCGFAFRVIDFDVSDNNIWILSSSNIYEWSKNRNAVIDSINISAIENVKLMLVDKNENIWIGSQKGLFFFNTKTKDLISYTHQANVEASITFNSIWCISEDFNRNIWVGTFSGGVNYIDLNYHQAFKTYKQPDRDSNLVVSSFGTDTKQIWIGSEGNGIYRLDTNDSTLKFQKITDGYNVKSLIVDNNQYLWAGTDLNGIIRYKIDNGNLVQQDKITTQNSNLLSDNIRKIIADRNGDIWVAYQINKATISHYSVANNSISHYSLDQSNKSTFILDIIKNDTLIWANSRNTVYQMNLKNLEIKEVLTERNVALNAQTILADSNNLWVGTIGNGILRYDFVKQDVDQFPFISTLAISIYSILKDNKQQLWMSTDNGIFKFDIQTKEVSQYTLNDGLQGLAFYPLASLKTKDDLMYFGGTNGFNSIDPNLLQEDESRDKIKCIITNITIDNSSDPLLFSTPNNEIENNTLILQPDKNNISISLSSNSFIPFNNISFKYRIKGYQEDWISIVGAEKTININQLVSGRYTLEIQTFNNSTQLEQYTLYIYKRPYIWQTWWAYLLYLLLLLFLLFYLYYTYNKRKERKYKRLMLKMEAEKDKEIRLAKSRFFVNVSHVLRTPLVLILATIDNLRKENINTRTFSILINNAMRLKNIVNELLDFTKIESTKLKVISKPVDVNFLIKTIETDFTEYADINKINLEIHLDHELTNPILLDANHLEKIILRILHNAFKNVKKDSLIVIESFSLRSRFEAIYTNYYSLKDDFNYDNCFSILIRNTGIGIPKDSLASIFENFQQMNANINNGAGIGLQVVKDLVLANQGMLEVYSEVGKGSDFLISFPIIHSNNETESIQTFTDDNLYNEISSETILLRDKPRILLAEYNGDLRYLVTSFLSVKYEIVEANNGQEACDILLEKEIDLIISDIMMPIMDGVSFLKWVKQQERFLHLPFILLITKTEMSSKLDSLSLGAELYLDKPVDLTFLMAAIDNIFIQRENLKAFYANNYYADVSELSNNEKDNDFLKKLIDILDKNINSSTMDIDSIASELNLSRSKFYSKIKETTGKTIVEYILQFKLRKAASLLLESDDPINIVMYKVGLKSQSYFSSTFKKEFGESPSSFVAKHRKKK